MPANNALTREDLLFLKRSERLAAYFDKIGAAKKLIAEARAEMEHISRSLGRAPKAPKTRSNKVLRAPKVAKTASIEYGVDLPDTLSPAERQVYAALQKAGTVGCRPRELVEETKLSVGAIGRATATLKKRKLISATGKTVNRIWKVGK